MIMIIIPNSNHNNSIVKPYIFASCGNDLAINIGDIRTNTSNNGTNTSIVNTIENAHSQAINNVVFDPRCEYTFISNSFDKTICVFDLRNTKEPICRWDKHHLGSKGNKKPSLSAPVFYKEKVCLFFYGFSFFILFFCLFVCC